MLQPKRDRKAKYTDKMKLSALGGLWCLVILAIKPESISLFLPLVMPIASDISEALWAHCDTDNITYCTTKLVAKII